MLNVLKTLPQAVRKFAREDEGAQVIEYALIIAVVSIGLVLGLSALLGDGAADSPFNSFIARVTTCLTGSGTCT